VNFIKSAEIEKLRADRAAMVKALEKIEYASRKDSLTDYERLQSVRTVVCAMLSRVGNVSTPEVKP
jgi:hypothetical protein